MLRTCHARGLAPLLLALTACSGMSAVQRPLATGAGFDPTKGYVAGRFEVLTGAEFGFSLRDEYGDEYQVTFGKRGIRPYFVEVRDATGITALPPGDYELAGWMHGPKVHSIPRASRTRFHIGAGHVMFLGTFDATTKNTSVQIGWRTGTQIEWRIVAKPLAADEALRIVQRAYPGFAAAQVECHLCTAPPSDAAAFALPAEPASPEFGRRTTVVHFRSLHGNYDAWGLQAWESFERAEEAGVRGAAKAQGDRFLSDQAAPDGVDDFGAYWQLLDKGFRNGRVNFTLRTLSVGAGVDIANLFWLVQDGREVWVNEGDREVYHSREAADAHWRG
jgi:hypothetical protein